MAITGQTATIENFQVSDCRLIHEEKLSLIQNIMDLRHRVVVVNPEEAFHEGGRFERLWKNSKFTSKIISVIWDEGHCISSWGSFQQEYKDAGRLRYLISRAIPFIITFATLPNSVRNDVLDILHVNRATVKVIHHSNDRPNVYLTVRRIKYSLASFEDLDFLIPAR